MNKKLVYIILAILSLQIAACVSCQLLTYDLDGIEKPYFLWLKEGAKFEFVSTKNDTTIFTITKIEKKKMIPQMNIPILGGGDLFHAPTNFYVHCNISGSIRRIKQESGLYMYIEKDNRDAITVNCRLGGKSPFASWGIRYFKFIDTLAIATRKFIDVEFFEYRLTNRQNYNMVSYVWSKHYGLLQYTTADSLVWTRINIEEPEDK